MARLRLEKNVQALFCNLIPHVSHSKYNIQILFYVIFLRLYGNRTSCKPKIKYLWNTILSGKTTTPNLRFFYVSHWVLTWMDWNSIPCTCSIGTVEHGWDSPVWKALLPVVLKTRILSVQYALETTRLVAIQYQAHVWGPCASGKSCKNHARASTNHCKLFISTPETTKIVLAN